METLRQLELPPVSVVIVGYNSRQYLDRCFGTLIEQRYPNEIELIFVDNNSSDGSVVHVRSTFPRVHVFETGANLGYAGGNNYGAQRAHGDVLVFLNPDTEVEPDWLVALVRPLVADPMVGLTTSKILMLHDRETINACGNDISLAGITWCRGAGQPASEFLMDADVPAVSGCSFAVSAALFRQLGGFDERFFMYLEDTDLSWRARVAGYRCRFVADSIVYHDYRLEFSPRKMELIERNRYRMLGKHLSLRGIIALSPALVAAEVLTWGYATLRGPKSMVAKARATGWAVTQLSPVLRARWRPIEGEILREHRPAPPVVKGLGGASSRLAQGVLSLLSRGAAFMSLRLLPISHERWRPSGDQGWTRADSAKRSEDAVLEEVMPTGAGRGHGQVDA